MNSAERAQSERAMLSITPAASSLGRLYELGLSPSFPLQHSNSPSNFIHTSFHSFHNNSYHYNFNQQLKMSSVYHLNDVDELGKSRTPALNTARGS